jgi:hypothetical protein
LAPCSKTGFIIIFFFTKTQLPIKNINSGELVAHACNPIYLGGRDQEDLGSKSALGKQFTRPYLKKPHHKKGLVELEG